MRYAVFGRKAIEYKDHCCLWFLSYYWYCAITFVTDGCNAVQVRLLKDKDTGQNKGYAFVTFMSEQNAEKAIETLNDSEVKVNLAFYFFDVI